MFVGYSGRGETLNLLHYSSQSLKEINRNGWYCPACHCSLIIKNGQKIRPHFAHKAKQECQSFSEAETAEHLSGKALLAKWCESIGVPYELEAYLPQLQQRPDLLIHQKIAIEFQCSSLPWSRFIERTETYLDHGFQVIWIFGSKLELKGKLREIQRSALAYSPRLGYYLWQLDVTRDLLTCCYHIEELEISHQICYSKRLFGRAKTAMSALLQPESSPIQMESRVYQIETVLSKIKETTQLGLLRRQQEIMRIQEILYREGANLNGLADDFLVPLTQPLMLKDSVILWRFYFWRACFENQGRTMTDIWHFFKIMCQKNNLATQSLPLVSDHLLWQQFQSELMTSFQRTSRIKLVNSRVIVLKGQSQGTSETQKQNSLEDRTETSYQISSLPQGDVLL
ncbi:hypothetical protein G7081_00830 [Vagococcus coleopterorum]|uniref:Competence protein CoiA n=1 Tax=Vagococcus coleopterorum TaxID=2714946 RepID=A0A6G8ALD0_9ENTE|nr:competence protein CoiA family protein [Vagococcus coleopterorum]QIL45733.1 hypothetical protein G7081_00830 [Vagococcus coleopterorum]